MSPAYRRYGDFGAASADPCFIRPPPATTLRLLSAEVESGFAVIAEARGPAAKLRRSSTCCAPHYSR